MTDVTVQGTESQRERNARGEGDKLRSDLLASALVLLSEASHPDEVSIRAIARHTGVSPTAAYRHFSDRDDLVYSAVLEAFNEFADRFVDAISDITDPFEAITVAGRVYRETALNEPGRYRVMFSNPMTCPLARMPANPDNPEDPVNPEDVENSLRAFRLLVALVDNCLEAGAVAAETTDDAHYLAAQLWTWIHGIVDLRITHPFKEWPDAERMFVDAQRTLGLVPSDADS